MFINGLVSGVHSSADNIVAMAMQYSVDIGARQRNNTSRSFFANREASSLSGCMVEGFGSGKMLDVKPKLALSVILEGLNVLV